MALIVCSECSTQVSDKASACPKCGNPIAGQAGSPQVTIATIDAPPTREARGSPVFVVLAVTALFLALFTPRFLVIFPIAGVMGCTVIALFRREKGRAIAVIVAAVTGALFFADQAVQSGQLGALSTSDGSSREGHTAAHVVNWTWEKDPSFGTRGTIKWNVEVRNTSDRYIKMARVEFTTYDDAGKLVGSTFAFVQAIPPGATRSTNSFADLYRNEANARVQVSSVTFER